MNDSEFLDWIADRLVCNLGDHQNVDFVLRLRRMAAAARPPNACDHQEGNVCDICAPVLRGLPIEEQLRLLTRARDAIYGLGEFNRNVRVTVMTGEKHLRTNCERCGSRPFSSLNLWRTEAGEIVCLSCRDSMQREQARADDGHPQGE